LPRVEEKARTAIVTGGGYGIGRAVVSALARGSWNVVTFDANGERNRETVELAAGEPGSVVAFNGSVADARAAHDCCASTVERFGGLNGLVNCAALRRPGTALELTEADWDETVDVCLKGTFLFCRAALPHIIAGGGGAIVNFSSRDAYGVPRNVAYSAAKAGVEALTRSLAADHLQDKVRVNAILPPFTVTGMTEEMGEAVLARANRRSPTGTAARPSDIANLAAFLLTDEAALFTSGIFGGRLPPEL